MKWLQRAFQRENHADNQIKAVFDLKVVRCAEIVGGNGGESAARGTPKRHKRFKTFVPYVSLFILVRSGRAFERAVIDEVVDRGDHEAA